MNEGQAVVDRRADVVKAAVMDDRNKPEASRQYQYRIIQATINGQSGNNEMVGRK